jgi:UDP-glucose 4-epimerase
VLASSCNNYDRTVNTDIDEETEQNLINPYAESRVGAEQLLSDLRTEYELNGIALWIGTSYG